MGRGLPPVMEYNTLGKVSRRRVLLQCHRRNYIKIRRERAFTFFCLRNNIISLSAHREYIILIQFRIKNSVHAHTIKHASFTYSYSISYYKTPTILSHTFNLYIPVLFSHIAFTINDGHRDIRELVWHIVRDSGWIVVGVRVPITRLTTAIVYWISAPIKLFVAHTCRPWPHDERPTRK